MKNILVLLLFCSLYSKSQKVNIDSTGSDDYSYFEKLTKEVKKHRENKHLSLNQFIEKSKEENTIILDIRSDSMYKAKHVKGAKHLDFSDFNEVTLSKTIPTFATKILLYCNNNFTNDPTYFVNKAGIKVFSKLKTTKLPLTIPAHITLYGYGYKNVYELSEYVPVFDERIEFEGSAVKK